MTKSRIIALSIIGTLTALALVFTTGAFVARAMATEVLSDTLSHGSFGHGPGGQAGLCARLSDEHVQSHASALSGWVVRELELDAQQSATLEPVTAELTAWSRDLAPLCEAPPGDAPAKVAAAVRFVETTTHSMQRFADTFTAFYATLNEEQRLKVDDWFAHRDAQHGPHP
jgi:hypothetical protein